MIEVAVQAHPSHYAALVGVVRESLRGRAQECRFVCVSRGQRWPSSAECGVYVVVGLAPLSDAERTGIMKATGCFQVVDLAWDERGVPERSPRRS